MKQTVKLWCALNRNFKHLNQMTKQGDGKPNLITKNRVSNTSLLDMIVTVCCALNNLVTQLYLLISSIINVFRIIIIKIEVVII